MTPEADDGYLPRGGVRPEDGVKYDAKHTWHHRPRLWPHMRETGVFQDPVMGAFWQEFMLLNERIWMIHREAVLLFATGLYAHPCTKNFELAHSLAMTMWLMPLRHVLYLPGESTGNSMVVGKAHHDRNSFTFHGFQRVGTVQAEIDGQWIELPTRRHYLRGSLGFSLRWRLVVSMIPLGVVLSVV